MISLTSLLSRLFGTSDPESGEVRASIEKLVAGLGAVVPGLIGTLTALGVIGPEDADVLSQGLGSLLVSSSEPLTLLTLGILWWRKRDQQDRNGDGS